MTVQSMALPLISADDDLFWDILERFGDTLVCADRGASSFPDGQTLHATGNSPAADVSLRLPG